MYRDYKKDRLNNLKTLNEGSINPHNLDNKSNPCLDVYSWDGKGELPTTIKSADLDAVIKKITHKEDENSLKKTEFFENAFDQVFGKGSEVTYRPYSDISDTEYRDNLLEQEYKKVFVREADDEKDEEKDNTKDLDSELDKIKSTQEDLEEYDEDDDDEDEDEDESVKENYMGFNLDEDANYDDEIETLSRSSRFQNLSENVSPISLLEDSEDSISNLDALLEQTQLIEDEVDSILNYGISENTSDFSDILEEGEYHNFLNEDDALFLEDSDYDEDLSQFLDEDLM